MNSIDSKTLIISFDSFLIAKYFHWQILPPGHKLLPSPCFLCPCVSSYSGGKKDGECEEVLSASELKLKEFCEKMVQV